mgnify:FL=1
MKKKHIIMLTLSFILLLAALQVSAAYKTSYSNEYYQPWGQTQYRYTIQADYEMTWPTSWGTNDAYCEFLVKQTKWNDAMTHPTDITVKDNKNLTYTHNGWNPDGHMYWVSMNSPRLNGELTFRFTMTAKDIPDTFWIKAMNKLFSTAIMFGDEARIKTYMGETSSSATLVRDFYPGA